MNIRKSALSITIARPADKQAKGKINASYGWSRAARLAFQIP